VPPDRETGPRDREPVDGQVANTFDGIAEGSVVQVGSVSGDINVHVARRPLLVPMQLPAGNPRFVGRVEELTRLAEMYASRAEPSKRRGQSLIVIEGMAGVGKTSLAVDWAHSMADEFPDGQLYLNLRGFDPSLPPLAPQDAISELLDSLGIAPGDVPATYDAQESLYRTLLAQRRMLLLLDNARSADQVRPLVPGGASTLLVVTSRNELPGLVSALGAFTLKLLPLNALDAEELLIAHIGRERVAADSSAVAEILRSCGRLPLALALVAARAAGRSRFPLAAIAGEVQDQSVRLDHLDLGEGDASVRSAFSWSYAALSSGAASLLGQLALLAGPDISRLAASTLAGVGTRDGSRLVAELARANLLDEYRPGRYRIHDLVRVYAAEHGQTVAEPARLAALRRLLDHYLRTSILADRILDPARRVIDLPEPSSDVQVLPIDSFEDALQWFEAESQNIGALAATAFRHALNEYCWQLAWAANTFLYWRAQWNETLHLQQLAVSATRHLGDDTARAKALRGLGRVLTRLDRFQEAEKCLLEVLSICVRTGDDVGQATTHHALSFMLDKQEHFERAVEHAQLALPPWRRVRNSAREARALNDLGWARFRAGSPGAGRRECQAALALFGTLSNKHGQTLALRNLARICLASDRLETAGEYAMQQIALEGQLGNSHSAALATDLLGDIRAAQGRDEEALAAWSSSYEAFQHQGRPEAAAIQRKIGRVLKAVRS
jgi:tetratricopeptide (TPR) repeat protein